MSVGTGPEGLRHRRRGLGRSLRSRTRFFSLFPFYHRLRLSPSCRLRSFRACTICADPATNATAMTLALIATLLVQRFREFPGGRVLAASRGVFLSAAVPGAEFGVSLVGFSLVDNRQEFP